MTYFYLDVTRSMFALLPRGKYYVNKQAKACVFVTTEKKYSVPILIAANTLLCQK